MLKHRDLHECTELYELLSHPSVFPFVRQKATSVDEYWFMTKQLIEEEVNGLAISRTITDDWGQPIGTISVHDVEDGAGFLGTWIGLPYQGKGYNQKAKLLFLKELFFDYNFNTIFLRIRTENAKSKRAALKLPYVLCAKESHPTLFAQVNNSDAQFNLYKIPRDLFYLTTANFVEDGEEQAM
ncbi:MAG: GNAT family N-acetyltransferase [Lysinibacillus sp.]